MDLSIIIPVFNTEPNKLKKCLNSILRLDKNKSTIKYEIVLIDDGSKIENSNEYKKLVEDINQIKYIYTENKGVSSARNLGIEKATGKYITFVDSDDCIIASNFKLDYLKNEKDIIIFDKIYIKNNKKRLFVEFDFQNEIVDRNFLIKELATNGKFHSVWGKIINRDFLKKNNIFFDTNLIQGEDAIFNLDTLKANPRILYINIPIYEYHYDIDTAGNRWKNNTEKMIKNTINVYTQKMQCIYELSNEGQEELINHFNENMIVVVFRMCMRISENHNDLNKYINYIVEYLEKCQINTKKLKILTRLKFKLIYYKCLKIIYIISKFRKVYWKYLKKIK